MKLKLLLLLSVGLNGLQSYAQTPLQYQLQQQGGGNCAGSPVELSVNTTVRLSTKDATEITVNTAISGGNVANDGGNPASLRGVCWNTSPNPTTANFSTTDGSGLGNFSSNLTGLSPNTTYYVRAYAINSVGTFYGNEVSFTTGNAANPTAHTCGAENVHNPAKTYNTITDQQGNVYKTIVIGTQEWMAENLRTTVYRNGNAIANVTDNAQWKGLTTGAWCFNNNDSQYDCPYGKLYNWYAVADLRNVCPTGWRVPTKAEWTTFTTFLGGEGIAGGKMKSTGLQYWEYGNQDATNESGFSGLPGGERYPNGTFNSFLEGISASVGTYGTWWSSAEYSTQEAWRCTLSFGMGNILSYYNDKRIGLSVRCLRDQFEGSINSIDCGSAANAGTLTKGTAASGVSSSVPYTGGNGGTHSGQIVNSTGVTGLTATLAAGAFASGSGSLTYTITGTPASSGTAIFVIDIGGQSCNLQIPVKPNQPVSTHTCGAENVHNPNLTYGSMTDQEGNVYKTIVIGNQEWMAENLKTSTYANGDPIPNITDNTQWGGLTTGAWCYYNNDSQFECPYGKLYNWFTVADPRNVCPTGWHVPTDDEWTSLTVFLSSGSVPGKLKSFGTQYWWSPNTAATNESGFSALPSGFRNAVPVNNVIYNGLGGTGVWWSSTGSSFNAAKYRALSFNGGVQIGNSSAFKKDGSSVRCLRD